MRRWILIGGSVLAALAAILLWPARPGVVRVGLVPFTSVNARVIEGFKEALAQRGFRDGVNVEYKTLPADGRLEKLDGNIARLMAWKPSLVLAASTPSSRAAYHPTLASGTPLVFAPVSDPLDARIVGNLMHPGEHVTGIRLASSNGLRLQWLQRIDPRVHSVYVPYSTSDKSATATLKQIDSAARALGIRLLLHPVESPEDIERAAREIPPGVDAIFLPQDSRIESRVALFVASALRRRVPLSAPSALQVEQGALMSFGFNHRDIGRQAGRLAAEILNGRKPGDLPVETAENVLYINQGTAAAIGLHIDDAVLRQAREIIRG